MQAILAVAGTIELYRSTDAGVTWSPSPHPDAGYAGLTASGGGIWLRVRNNAASDVAYVSGDLDTWAPVTLPITATWVGLYYLLGQFYLFSDTTTYYTSADGEAWTAHTAPVAMTADMTAADNGSGLILAFPSTGYHASNSRAVYSITAGEVWTAVAAHVVPADSGRSQLFWTGGSFSIASIGANPVLSKTVDGTSWSDTAITGLGVGYHYAADSVRGMVTGGFSANFGTYLGNSTSLSIGSFPVDEGMSGIAVVAGRMFVFRSVSPGTGALQYSDDGAAWVTVTPSPVDFAPNFIALVAGELPDSPSLLDTLTFDDILQGTVKIEAVIHDQLNLSSTLSLTLLLSATHFDTLLLSDLVQTRYDVSAELLSVLELSTEAVGITVDGGRVLLGEPIQYGVNAATGALTRYQGFGFAGFARCGQVLYGAKTDGLYRIRPGSDDGEPVQVQIDLGDSDFGTALGKTIESVYLGLATDGSAYVRLKAGDTEHTYRAVQKGEMARAVTGKGLAGRRWSISLEIADATELTLDMVEVRLGASGRRLRARN